MKRVVTMMNQQSMQKNKFSTRQLTFIGLMAAIVFVSNYIQFKIPIGIGGDMTRIHVANAFCLLGGIVLGPVAGGLSAGIGSALFDILDPVFITSAPFTFVFKFLMAFVAGLVAGKRRLNTTECRNLIAASAGQMLYIALYIGKKFITYYFFHREPIDVVLATCTTSLISSLVNAVISVLLVVLLVPAFSKILKSMHA